MRSAIWITLLTTLATGVVVNGQDQDSPLKVMSFNIRYGTAQDGENRWDLRKDLLVDTIRAFKPDLLGTQETLKGQRDFLAEKLPDYTVVGVGRDDGREKGEMTAVYFNASRFELLDSGHFWLSETPDVPGSKSWDTSLTRMVTWLKLRDRQASGEPELHFFNTHYDHRGRQAQAESSALLRRRILELGPDAAVIVTGDFNAAEGSEPYQRLFAPQADGTPVLLDVFRIAHPERLPHEGTFHGFRGTPSDGGRIDWIACTPQFRALSAEINTATRDGRAPSDHFPVQAILKRTRAE